MPRPELATVDGSPPPQDLPAGDCILTTLADGSIRIDRADPRVLISAELLREVFIEHVPDVTIRMPAEAENGTPFWLGAILKIAAVNQTVIYRITGYIPKVHAYIAEWPD